MKGCSDEACDSSKLHAVRKAERAKAVGEGGASVDRVVQCWDALQEHLCFEHHCILAVILRVNRMTMAREWFAESARQHAASQRASGELVPYRKTTGLLAGGLSPGAAVFATCELSDGKGRLVQVGRRGKVVGVATTGVEEAELRVLVEFEADGAQSSSRWNLIPDNHFTTKRTVAGGFELGAPVRTARELKLRNSPDTAVGLDCAGSVLGPVAHDPRRLSVEFENGVRMNVLPSDLAPPAELQLGQLVWLKAHVRRSGKIVVHEGGRGTVLGRANDVGSVRIRVKFESSAEGTESTVTVPPSHLTTAAPPPLPDGLEPGEVVWLTCDLTEGGKMLVHAGCRATVLKARESDGTVKVECDEEYDGTGTCSAFVDASMHLTRTQPEPKLGFRVGDACWSGAALELGTGLFSESIPALTAGTIIGHSPTGVHVRVRFGEFGATPVLCKASLIFASEEAARTNNASLVAAQRRQREAQLERDAERLRAERERMAQKALEEEEARRRTQKERAAEERRHAEMEVQAKERRAEARRRAEEESAAAKARAKADAAEREAKRAAAEAQREDVGTAIYRATCDGHLRSLRQQLKRLEGLGVKKRKAVQRWCNESGQTHLYVAAERNRAEEVVLLLDAHFALDLQLQPAAVGFEGATPLYAACERGHLRIVQILLQRGADPTRLVRGELTYSQVSRDAGHAEVADTVERAAEEWARRQARESARTQARETASTQPTAASSELRQPSGTAQRYQPRLNAITEDFDENLEEGEREGEGEGEREGGDGDGESGADEGAEGSGDEARTDRPLSYWQEQLETASTAEALRRAISAVELADHDRLVYGSTLDQARDRLEAMQLAAATSLESLGCALPSHLIAGGGLSLTSSSIAPKAFVSAHTILVVDCSGSMKRADVVASEEGARITRAQAVRDLLGQNFLRTQIDAGAVASERVSLIKIQGLAGVLRTLPFALFPLDASLSDRIADSLGEPHSHGPYLPALRLLARLVELVAPYLLPRAKTSVLFLSDGRPSDRVDQSVLPRQLDEALVRVHAAFTRTHSFLEAFQLLGFGEVDEDVLRAMARSMPGNVATFQACSGAGSYKALAQSVSTFSSSVVVSRLSSVSHIDGPARVLRSVNRTLDHHMARYNGCQVVRCPDDPALTCRCYLVILRACL